MQRQGWILKKSWVITNLIRHTSSISTPEIPVKNPHAYQKLISLAQEETEVEKTLAMAAQHKLQSHEQNGVAMLEWICLGNRFWSCLPL